MKDVLLEKGVSSGWLVLGLSPIHLKRHFLEFMLEMKIKSTNITNEIEIERQ